MCRPSGADLTCALRPCLTLQNTTLLVLANRIVQNEAGHGCSTVGLTRSGGTTIILDPPDPYDLTDLVQTTCAYYFTVHTDNFLMPRFPSVLAHRTSALANCRVLLAPPAPIAVLPLLVLLFSLSLPLLEPLWVLSLVHRWMRRSGLVMLSLIWFRLMSWLLAGRLFRLAWRTCRRHALTLRLRTVFIFVPQPVATCLQIPVAARRRSKLASILLPEQPPSVCSYLAAK